ncbi:MAG TPA: rhomboid family intramembrane serine protease [Candidatus Cybelea sp.]|nr:rhomboid family intramembrane serine protease [Candidatus Cybelea sp.]
MELSPRLRWKIDRFKQKLGGALGGKRENGRPKLCPACGTLVGSSATRCHQCGANLMFSLAAASRSLSKLMPETSPATYGILTLSCLMYAISLVWTMRLSGFEMPSGGGLGAIMNLGGIASSVLDRLGASVPLFPFYIVSGVVHPGDFQQPWRFVTAVFLHGSLLHMGFNMWVLMDIGPMIEDLYGSARYLFIYVVTGIAGYVLSSFSIHFSVGGSGALLGLIGVMLAVTMGRKSASMQMLRGQIIRWLIYIAILGLLPGLHIDNMAHLGGFVAGFILGKLMVDRAPVAPEERKRAYLLGWASALLVLGSFALVAFLNLRAG